MTDDNARRVDYCLTGAALYGDDFGDAEIAAWYQDEKEGYADLGSGVRSTYRYVYHSWNTLHGYRYLPNARLGHVLGFGSAYGDELLPVISRIDRITIVDPSDAFATNNVHGVQAQYLQPSPTGVLPLVAGSVDLATCLGVLHHIPNVSFVVGELARTLKSGGHLLLREPIVSMGDWRQPRKGLTLRERGIPLPLLKAIVLRSGFRIVRETLCGFPLIPRLFRPVRPDVYNSNMIARIDKLMSSALRWNYRYHAQTALQHLRPTSAFLVLQRT